MSLIEMERKVDITRDKYALEEGYIDSSLETSPWIPFLTDNVFVRYLTFDIRNNSTAVNLKIEGPGGLGVHRHRGPVQAMTLEGSWRYAEYDWVSQVGDYVRESPGRSHTLMTDNGAIIFFQVHGTLEFLDDEENTNLVVDTFWMINHYETYCRENGLPINKSLFL
ncbi:2,4'-dihydroxyacetophenone dioxygenase family protein [Alkalicoccus halolimnae]|uniref:2,4'-dihydroxyacetophenone dioxygenase family protein n=1 Tax=Alkalicoccus halolimnae TaxID=1667239 RepID=A0A5C7FG90_9BACI|nr:2,4'-dihydroxyacetophenone dioxygenase family protein [Alkalicoccus halolimnae]TXF85284.1 tRNA modification GTPase [Alkalicoccus halolimnae]